HFECRRIDGVLVAEALEFLDERRRCDSLNGILAGWINIENQHHIREIECPREIVKEMERSRVSMRLEDRKNAAEISRLRGTERRANFGRMMSVVVDDGYAVTRLDLESPIDSAETFERRGNDMRLNAHIARRREGRSRVQDVVHARHVQLHALRASAVETYGERGTQTLQLNIADANVGGRCRSVRHDPALNLRDQRLNRRIVQT